MEQRELIVEVAKEVNLSEDEVTKIFASFISTIKGGLIKGEKVTIAGFGTFSLSKRKATTFQNPRDGKTHQIPERSHPLFKADDTFEKSVSQ